MGMCLREFGPFSIEVRSESIIILYESEGGADFIEIEIDEVPDLLAALADATQYMKDKGIIPC